MYANWGTITPSYSEKILANSVSFLADFNLLSNNKETPLARKPCSQKFVSISENIKSLFFHQTNSFPY